MQVVALGRLKPHSLDPFLPSKRALGLASQAGRDTIQATQRKRVTAPQVTKSVEEAKASTQTFLASVRLALQFLLASQAGRDTIQAAQRKRVTAPQVTKSVEEAKASTQTFLASVRLALQFLLATLPAKQDNPCAVLGCPTCVGLTQQRAADLPTSR
jgi:hypothetical protein